jgi:4'-phosphopantetheinyl transferase EntD
MKIVALPPAWSERVLVVTQVEDPESWFAPDEVPEFALKKRRLEWMLSRIAAKELANRRGAEIGDVTTHSSTLSLSHSRGFGAAAMDDGPVGVDIELPREIKRAAAHLFLDDDETAAMERCSIPFAMLHFWCAKEAAWKQGGGRIPTLRQVRLRLEEERADGLRFDRVETFIGEIVVALTRKIQR